MMQRFDGFADICSNAVTDFFKKNYLIILAGFLAGLYVNGFDITNTILSIDKEGFWQWNESGHIWFLNERWGMFLLNKLIPLTQYQFISQITGLILLSIAGAIIIYKHNNIPTNACGGGILFCVLFTSYPIFLSMETFTFQIAYHNIAIFLAVVSYVIFDKSFKSKKYVLLIPSLICLVLAIGSYQSLFSFFPAVFAIKLFIEYTDNNINIKEMIKRTLLVILFLCAAILSNYIIVKILGYSDIKYQSNWFNWAKYSVTENITNIFGQIYSSVIGSKQYPTLNFIALLSLFAAWLHVFKVKKQPRYKTAVEFLFLIILFIGSTHSVIIALGGNIILRTLSVLSIFFAGSIFIYYMLGSKIEKLLIIVFVMFSVFYNGSVMTRQYMSGYYTMQSDQTLATLILSKVYNVAPGFYTGQTPIAFIGAHDYGTRSPIRTQSDDVMGGSFWQWDNGNPGRMLNFIRIVSGVPMEARLADTEQYQKALEYSKNMPKWPDKDSVQLHDGVVIVKLAVEKK